ncbi:MAG: putative bifunctional diguanylate cyclase/phosphodiesterase [Candidatus Dormibacteria bacterium]
MSATRLVLGRWRNRLRPPADLLAGVQWLLLLLALVSLALAVAIIAAFSSAPEELRLCSFAGVGWLAWWLLSGYRLGHFPVWKDLLAFVALFVVGVGSRDSSGVLAVLFATLYFRALYASPEGAAGVALGFAAADLGAIAVAAGWARAPMALERGFSGVLALAMAAMVMQVLRSVIARRRGAARRERTLRRVGKELMVADSPAAVYRAVRRVAAEVVGTPGAVQVALTTLGRSQFQVISAGRSLDRLPGEARVDSESLPPETMEQLLGITPVAQGAEGRAALLGLLRIAPSLPHLRLIPLHSGGQPLGAFGVATVHPLAPDQEEVLEILADECALALSRAAISEDLRRSEGRFRSLVQNSSDLIMAMAADGVFSYLSPAVELLLGARPSSPSGFDLSGLLHPSDRQKVLDAIEEARSDPSGTRKIECRIQHHDHSWRHLELSLTNLLHDPYVGAVVLTGRDITERRELEDQLRHQALHDPLTGLANRALLRDRLEHALKARRDGRSTLGLLSVDLDDFKTINDSYGHAIGDAVLLEVTRRIGECLRPADTFARLGGDEFAVLIEKMSGTAVATAVADRIGEVLAQPIAAPDGLTVTVGASVGLITTKYATADAEALLRDADIALYQAKSEGKGRSVEFHPSLHQQAVQRMHVETGLRRALERQEMHLLYQPIVSAPEHQLIGVEALLRWRDPDRSEWVSPDDFIQVAETTGLIVPIGRWVLYEACRQMGEWRRRHPGRRDLRLSVNVSARQLQHQALVEDVQGAIAGSGIDPGQLVLEVTESTIVKDVEQASVQLRALRRLGIRIAIDDFGTGQSSLAQLHHLPVDELKIDRSFMVRIQDGKSGVAVAESVVNLARALSLTVVIEGVETKEQVKVLESLDNDPMLQGFFFAEPLPATDVDLLIGKLDLVARPARTSSRRGARRQPPADSAAAGRVVGAGGVRVRRRPAALAAAAPAKAPAALPD